MDPGRPLLIASAVLGGLGVTATLLSSAIVASVLGIILGALAIVMGAAVLANASFARSPLPGISGVQTLVARAGEGLVDRSRSPVETLLGAVALVLGFASAALGAWSIVRW